MKGKTIPKMMTVLLLILTIMALPLVSVPTVSAKTLKFDLNQVGNLWPNPCPDPRHINDDPTWVDENDPTHPIPYWGYWVGDIAFLPGITGKYYCVTTYYTETGKVGHGIEDFYIEFWQGNDIIGTVAGYDKAVVVYSNWKVRANGWITDASANFAYLKGCMFQYELSFIDPNAIPVLSIGTCFFAGVN